MKRVFSTFYIEKLKFSLNVSSHPQSTTYLLLSVVPNVYCISSTNSSCQPLLYIALCTCRLPFAVAIRYFQLDSHNNVVAQICLPNLFISLTRQYCQLFIYHKSRPRYPKKCIQLCFSYKNLGWIQLLLFTKINSPFSCLYWLIIYHNRHSWHVG